MVAPFSLILCLIWGELTWAHSVHAMHRTVQVCGNLMFIIYSAYVYAYAIGVAGVGESVTAWLVGLQVLPPGILRRTLCPVHRSRLPGRKHRHDRDHRAAALPCIWTLRYRPNLVRGDPGDVCGARADLAADRHQSVCHPEYLGRRAGGRRDGHENFRSTSSCSSCCSCWLRFRSSRCGCRRR